MPVLLAAGILFGVLSVLAFETRTLIYLGRKPPADIGEVVFLTIGALILLAAVVSCFWVGFTIAQHTGPLGDYRPDYTTNINL
jgi:hypothetical protein